MGTYEETGSAALAGSRAEDAAQPLMTEGDVGVPAADAPAEPTFAGTFFDLERAQLDLIDRALGSIRVHGAPSRTTSHATWQDDRGMNDRVKKLRHQSETTQPYLDMERALIETKTYLAHEGELSQPELRGMVLRDYFAEKTIRIEPGELIVGEKGRGPQAAPTFPELCCHTLEDMHNMNDREQVNFCVTEDDLAAQRDIVIPFWRRRASRERIMEAQTPAWHDAFEAGIFTEFYEQRAGGHTCLGSERGAHAGFDEIRGDIEGAIEALDYFADEHATEKRQELSGMLLALEGVQVLATRYAELAGRMAAEEADPARAAELAQIAENCRVVAHGRPRTFWQWIQRYWFIHLAITSETNPWDAYTPGRLDQHLIGYYAADVDAGRLTRDQALELLECLWVKFNNQPAPPKVGVTLKESGTYSDFANINTGGITPERAELYRICEQNDVGITVMKGYAGGRLFDAATSPFGVALTPVQCLHYALTRPAVATVLAGFDSTKHVDDALAYETASDEEKDYATVLANAPRHAYSGQCTYCGHCAPCPAGIDIAMVNKLLDLALMQPEVPATVRAHYEGLSANGSDCIACGGCERRCPFGVKAMERMKQAEKVFG